MSDSIKVLKGNGVVSWKLKSWCHMLLEPCPKQNGALVQKPQIISMSAQKRSVRIGQSG
jgi:hypothetical protein